MGNRGDFAFGLWFDVGYHCHEASGHLFRYSSVEKIWSLVDENRRSKRSKRFAEFYLGVDDFLHLRSSGIRQDRPIAEGPRPPFESPLHPANDRTSFQSRRRSPAEYVLVVEALMFDRLRVEVVDDRTVRMFLAPIRVIHLKLSRTSGDDMMCPEGCAECTASISGSRLNEDLVESRLPKYSTVGDAI